MSTVAYTTCSKCGQRQPETRDFCVCGEYLRWQSSLGPVGPVGPVGQVVPVAPGPQGGEPEAKSVWMTVDVVGAPPRDEGVELTASVLPNNHVELSVRLRNVGTIVDTFTISVHGLPADWVTIGDSTVELLPFGAEPGFEAERRIVVRPLRSPRSTAGPWPFSIRIASKAPHAREVTWIAGTLNVEAFVSVVATARPILVAALRRARFRCDVLNNGNSDITPTLLASDAQEKLAFTLPRTGAELGPTTIAPGGTRSFPIGVRAPMRWIGVSTDHQISIVVKANAALTPAMSAQGQIVAIEASEVATPPVLVIFRQRALIPVWLLPLLLLLLAIALALYLLWPRKVTMPALRGLPTAFEAQKALKDAGLTGVPTVQTRIQSVPKAGTVLGQTPRPGARVAPDEKVVITVVVGTNFTIVPDLSKMTVGKADSQLTRSRLVLGEVVPNKKSTGRVIRQIPLAGRARPRGTKVDIVLAARGKVPVPDVRCLTSKRAERKLTSRGFLLGPLPPALDPADKVLSQLPEKGIPRRPGTVVTLIFKGDKCRTPAQIAKAKQEAAAKAKAKAKADAEAKKNDGATGGGGAPGPSGAAPKKKRNAGELSAARALAFESGENVRLARRAKRLSPGRAPAWSPDGRLAVLSDLDVVVRRVGVRPADAERTTIASAGALPDMARFAPLDLPDPVLAFIASPARGTSWICFATVAAAAAPPSCRRLPVTAGSLTWSAGATTILVAGASPGARGRSGIVRLTSTTPAATDAAQWHSDGRVLRPLRGTTAGNVFDIAYRPGGKEIGLVIDVGPGGRRAGPQVAIVASAGLLALRGARWLGTDACQIAWSASGARLAVVEPDPDKPGCTPSDAAGRLVSFRVAAPRVRVLVAKEATRPAWRPPAKAG